MPLRTVVLLLLLYMSVGTCATLGHYQAQEAEEAPAVADGAAADAGEEDGVAPADAQAGDAPAANSLFGDNLLSNVLDNIAADGPAMDAPVVEGATAEEPGAESDRPAGDAPAMEAPVVEGTAAEEPGAESDRPAGDAPAMEAPVEEEVSDEQPSSSENDIRAVRTDPASERPLAHEETSWGLNSIRNSFQTVHGYFDSLVELVGGHDGVCQYRCRYGEPPQPRPGYQVSEPDGCSSSLVGFQVNAALDLGIPAMTQCCNLLDLCYETCGINKYDCDSEFRVCLQGICSDLNKSLGFVTKVQACESMADTLYNTVWTLGCRPYMNSQRAACVCEGEERDEL